MMSIYEIEFFEMFMNQNIIFFKYRKKDSVNKISNKYPGFQLKKQACNLFLSPK